jgi:hypothetical protein
MTTVLIVAAVSLSNILCFMIGARVGQKVTNGEEVKLPEIDPMKAIREHRERTEAEIEQQRFNAILENIDNYNGTAAGQKEVR